MVFGAAGFVAFSVCVRPLLTKTNALAASSISCVIWIVVAVVLPLGRRLNVPARARTRRRRPPRSAA